MKKILSITVGMFLLSIGAAFADCDYHSNSKELTRVPVVSGASVVLVEVDNKRVELAKSASNEKRYNVTTNKGQSLAVNLSKEDLSAQFPELYQALKG
ncbi:MAG: hypothetical protein HQM13_12925 [SAR324 cluster bacterium]|nr:hypothetical protein [SAR324 cluster bacterium]